MRLLRRLAVNLFLADSAAALIAGIAVLCTGMIPAQASDFFSIPVLFVLGCLGYFAFKGHYGLRAVWWAQVEQILYASLAAFILSSLAIYASQIQILLPANGLLWTLMPTCLIMGRWIARSILMKQERWAITTTLVGSYEMVMKLIPALKAESYLAFDIRDALLLDAEDVRVESFKSLCPGVTLHATMDTLPLDQRHVFFCPDYKTFVNNETISKLERNAARFAYVPPMENYFFYNVEPRRFFGFGIIALETKKAVLPGIELLLKDIVDRLGAAIALTLLSPLFVLLSWAIRKDGGPAMYGHRRIGKNGQSFTCLKFRSMVVNSQEILNDLLARDPAARKEFQETYKLKNDPRVTKVGRLLRKTSLDELPQLLNVLCGHMSLMGPRPIVEDEKKYYAGRINDYLSVKPGITGLWQVSGRSDTSYTQRVYLDSWYVRNWSLWNDMIIFFKTILVVLKRKGAY
jgi:Undecaprenyl-phosphate galactose phosphotransferase WbaP